MGVLLQFRQEYCLSNASAELAFQVSWECPTPPCWLCNLKPCPPLDQAACFETMRGATVHTLFLFQRNQAQWDAGEQEVHLITLARQPLIRPAEHIPKQPPKRIGRHQSHANFI
jgi:hypothetical protein